MAREYTRDASEYGQQLIADAIDRLAQSSGSGSNSGGESGSASFSLDNFMTNINITQNQPEKQLITIYEQEVFPCLVDENGQSWWNEHNDEFPENGKIAIFITVSLGIENKDNNYECGNLVIDVVSGSCSPADPDAGDETGGTYNVSLGSTINVTATNPVPLNNGGGEETTS